MVWLFGPAERVAGLNITTPGEGRMVEQYLGEIKLVAFNFAPVGWAMCAGQIIPLQQNTALFSLLGTMYGGNGTTNFGLPDLRGRAAGHVGQNLYTTQGMMVGSEGVTITSQEYPLHNHSYNVNGTAGTEPSPTNSSFLATATAGHNLYVAAQGAALQPLFNGSPPPNPATIGFAPGGSQPHENMQPFEVLTYVIALSGQYPPRG
jgi:microcystin-dependent protein